MTRKITYWVSTGLVAALSAFAPCTYLSGSLQAVQGFAHVGYPQQLRIILGIAKLLGAITLLGQTQGVGLCRIHLRMDLGICCALSGERWPESVPAGDIAVATGHLLCDSAGKPPVPGHSHPL